MKRSRAVRILQQWYVCEQKLVKHSLSQLHHKYIGLQNETDVRTVDPNESSGEATWHSQTALK